MALSTWHYGHAPTSPMAGHVASHLRARDKRFWTEILPVKPLLEGLFIGLHGMPKAEFDAQVLITRDVDEAAAFLRRAHPGAGELKALEGGRPMAGRFSNVERFVSAA